MKVCKMIDCGLKHFGLGFCRKHYERYKRKGFAESSRRENNIGTLKEIFSKYCDEKDINECWLWKGLLYKNRYGRLVYKTKDLKAHRVSYELNKGIIEGKLVVCHSCDNPQCVNPNHLWLGSHKDNSCDAVNKKRNVFGERHPKAKLSIKDVKQIRLRIKNGETRVSLAAEYGMNQSVISKIYLRQLWKSVE